MRIMPAFRWVMIIGGMETDYALNGFFVKKFDCFKALDNCPG
jgi:hypothetical protein